MATPSASVRYTMRRRIRPSPPKSGLAPDVAGKLNNQSKLSVLRLRRHRIAGVDAGKAALRAYRKTIERHVPARLLDPRAQCCFVFQRRGLRRNQPKHDRFMLRNETQRSKRARTWSVVLEKIERNVQRIEQSLGDILIAALGMPMAAAIATAQMHSDAKRRRRCAQDPVGDVNIIVDQPVPVVAARCQCRLYVGIAEFCEGRFVDLDIATARLRQSFEFPCKGVDDVIPDLFDIARGGREPGGIAAAKMQRAWPRNCDLGKQRRSVFKKVKIGNIDGMGPTPAVFDEGTRLCSTPAAR